MTVCSQLLRVQSTCQGTSEDVPGVSVDVKGRVTVYRTLADYNQGLIPIKTPVDAQTVAAAILTLYAGDRVGPGPVAATEVAVSRLKKGKLGWVCRVIRVNAFQAKVVLDKGGKCLSVSKVSTSPPPQ